MVVTEFCGVNTIMSVIPVLVGQCGNQVGSALYEVLERVNEPLKTWVDHAGKRQAVLVDSEPKVLKYLSTKLTRSKTLESNFIKSRQGCGSNWALGYYGCSRSDGYNLLEEALEVVRKQTERCDAFSGFILMQSLAGGTGSGLGSHLIEKLRDNFGLAYILSVAVAPFSGGESPLQYYNTILTTSWLQRYCDGILLFQNDDVLQNLVNITSANFKANSSVSVSMNDLNQKIAQSLASLIQPIDALNPTNGVLSEQEPWELLRSVCPMPACKFVSIHHTVQSKANWERITRNLLHSIRKYSTSGEPFSSISNLVVVRGDSHNTFPACIPAMEKAIVSSCHCVPWNPYPVDFWQGLKHFHLKPNEASVTLCSNNTSVVELVQNSLDKAKAMFMAKGYLHWYARYGCTEEVFEDAFEANQSIIDNYQSAVT